MKRPKKPKPYCCNTMTEAGLRSFIMSGVRSKSLRWKPRSSAIASVCVGKGLNPATGRQCNLHKCPSCGGLFPQNQMDADHLEPVVPLEGFPEMAETWLGYNWTEVLKRLFCEADGFRVLCKKCHKAVTKKEQIERKRIKDLQL